MNLKGELVSHASAGLGQIEAQDADSVTVQYFSGARETYPFPKCFSGTLRPADEFVARELEAAHAERAAAKAHKYRDEF